MKTTITPLGVFILSAILLVAPVGARADSSAAAPIQLNPTVIACLTKAIGQSAFDAIRSGSRPPTDQEAAASADCFTQSGYRPIPVAPPVSNAVAPIFNSQTQACLTQQLGQNFAQQLKDATMAQSKDLAAKVGQCFAKPAQAAPIASPSALPTSSASARALPAAIKQCLIRTVGQQTATTLLAGDGVVDAQVAQKISAAGCFKDLPVPTPAVQSAPPTLPTTTQDCLVKHLGAPLANAQNVAETTREAAYQACFPPPPGFPAAGATPSPLASAAPAMPQLPNPLAQCLKEKLGDQSSEINDPASLSDTQRSLVASCFSSTSFSPASIAAQQHAGGQQPNIPSRVKECVQKITGKPISAIRPDQVNDQQKQQIAQECFGGKQPPMPSLSPGSPPMTPDVMGGQTQVPPPSGSPVPNSVPPSMRPKPGMPPSAGATGAMHPLLPPQAPGQRPTPPPPPRPPVPPAAPGGTPIPPASNTPPVSPPQPGQ